MGEVEKCCEVQYSLGTGCVLALHSMRTAGAGPDYSADGCRGQEENSEQKNSSSCNSISASKRGRDFERAGRQPLEPAEVRSGLLIPSSQNSDEKL